MKPQSLEWIRVELPPVGIGVKSPDSLLPSYLTPHYLESSVPPLKAPDIFLQIARTVPNTDLFLRVGKLRPKGKKVWAKIKRHNGSRVEILPLSATRDLCRGTKAVLVRIAF